MFVLQIDNVINLIAFANNTFYEDKNSLILLFNKTQ